MAVKVIRELATRFSVTVKKSSVRQAERAMKKLRDNAAKTGKAMRETLTVRGAKGAVTSGRALALGAAGVAGGGAISVFSERIRQMGDALGKTSLVTGLSTDALQELGFVADRSGISAESMNDSLRSLRLTMEQAARGRAGEEAVRFISEMGINAQTTGKDMEFVTDRLADFIAAQKDVGRQLFILQNLGLDQNTLKVWSAGAKSIRSLRTEARALGGILSKSLIKELETYTDEQTRLMFAVRGIGSAVAGSGGLIFALRRLNNTFLGFVQRNKPRLVAFFGKASSSAVESFGKSVAGIGDIFESILRKAELGELSKTALSGFGILAFVAAQPKLALLSGVLLVIFDILTGISEVLSGTDPLSFTGQAIRGFKEFFQNIFSFDSFFGQMKAKKDEMVLFFRDVLKESFSFRGGMLDFAKKAAGGFLGDLFGGPQPNLQVAGKSGTINVNVNIASNGNVDESRLAGAIKDALVPVVRSFENQAAASAAAPSGAR